MFRVGDVLIVNDKVQEEYLIRIVEYKPEFSNTLVCGVLNTRKTPFGYRCDIDKIRKKLEIHNATSQNIRKLNPAFIKHNKINYIIEYGCMHDTSGNEM